MLSMIDNEKTVSLSWFGYAELSFLLLGLVLVIFKFVPQSIPEFIYPLNEKQEN